MINYGITYDTFGDQQRGPGRAAGFIAMLLSVIVYLRHLEEGELGAAQVKPGDRPEAVFRQERELGCCYSFAIVILSLVISVIGLATNTKIDTNTGILLASEPIWFYLFTVLISPVCEEVLFRAFMVPRLGIIWSAVIFGLAQ